jgi:hypothetical protein
MKAVGKCLDTTPSSDTPIFYKEESITDKELDDYMMKWVTIHDEV